MVKTVLRWTILLGLLSASSFAQHVDPYLKARGKNLLAKSPDRETEVLVSGSAGIVAGLRRAGFDVQTDAGRYATVRLSFSRLDELTRVDGIRRITLVPEAQLHNSEAVNYQNVQDAYAKGYTGSDVLVAIVDTGIDFYHPMFRKANGDTRVLFLWDQTRNGSAPAGFTYGSEYSQSKINQDLDSGSPHSVVPQRDTDGHGTHVAGSAAGYDYGISPPDTISGGAREANLIIVKTSLKFSEVIDAVNYAFGKATLLDKPCVVNLSLGTQYGPHDGTDDVNRAIDELSGPGKVVVRSAGNDGYNQIHYYKENVVSSETVSFDYAEYLTYWLEAGDNLQSASLTWATGSISNITKGNNGKSGAVELYLEAAPEAANNKIAAYVFIEDSTLEGQRFTLTLNGLSDANNNNRIGRHAWAERSAFPEPFDGFSMGSSYDANHYSYTLGNEACANSVIAVGAFITRQVWPSVDGNNYLFPNSGNIGGIASFSSIGPTEDGRHKPEVIAGGTIILSSRSKDAAYADAFIPPAPYDTYYGYQQGTSMAAPVATGAIALLLEKNPNWDDADLRVYFSGHSRGTSRPAGVSASQLQVKEDPNIWDNVFGYGAIDLSNAFEEGHKPDDEDPVVATFELQQNFPNPFNPLTYIRFQTVVNGRVTLKVYNTLGQEISTLLDENLQADEYTVDFSAGDLSSGIYFYRLQNEGYQKTRKMVIVR